jgi:hypothetical protein
VFKDKHVIRHPEPLRFKENDCESLESDILKAIDSGTESDKRIDINSRFASLVQDFISRSTDIVYDFTSSGLAALLRVEHCIFIGQTKRTLFP